MAWDGGMIKPDLRVNNMPIQDFRLMGLSR
jgi:hypothetical protein